MILVLIPLAFFLGFAVLMVGIAIRLEEIRDVLRKLNGKEKE